MANRGFLGSPSFCENMRVKSLDPIHECENRGCMPILHNQKSLCNIYEL